MSREDILRIIKRHETTIDDLEKLERLGFNKKADIEREQQRLKWYYKKLEGLRGDN